MANTCNKEEKDKGLQNFDRKTEEEKTWETET